MISIELIHAYGGRIIRVAKNEMIFRENSPGLNYYQVISGQVKMANCNAEGQEFIQGLFETGESFGEPALFGDFNFPASAIALEDSELIKLTKDHFFQLLQDHFEIHKKFNKKLSLRLRYKGMILKEISSHTPEHRIRTLLVYLKEMSNTNVQYEVPLTRQQIADMTGLRVETVIRTIKKMDAEKELEIINHKVMI